MRDDVRLSLSEEEREEGEAEFVGVLDSGAVGRRCGGMVCSDLRMGCHLFKQAMSCTPGHIGGLSMRQRDKAEGRGREPEW